MRMNKHIKDKQHMWRVRGFSSARCDHCEVLLGQQSNKHELFGRGKVGKKHPARPLLMHEHLSALLCVDCHTLWHDRVEKGGLVLMRDMIFLRLYQLYGYHEVQATFSALQSMLRIKIDYRLPDR